MSKDVHSGPTDAHQARGTRLYRRSRRRRRCAPAPAADARARRLAPRARRADGRVRRLHDAGPVRRDHGRASVDPRACGAVRCQPHGPAAGPRAGRRRGAGNAAAGRAQGPGRPQASLFAAARRHRRHRRRFDGDPPRRGFLLGRQRRDQAWRHRNAANAGCRARSCSTICGSRRCWRCRGPKRSTCSTRWCPALPR